MGLTRSDIDDWLKNNPDLAKANDELVAETANDLRTFEDILREVGRASRERVYGLARDDPPEIKFKSKTEERAWREWVPTMGCVKALYEPITLHLPSGRYTPDFLLLMPTREMLFVEVKGSWNAYQSGRSSKKSLIEAANVFWFMGRWHSLLPEKGGGWNFTEIQPHVHEDMT